MARRRFFVDEVKADRAELSGDDGRHLARVLRAAPGQQFELSDNRVLYLGEVESVRKDSVVFRIMERLPDPPPLPPLTLVAGLIKFERMEWMIEKATELGVERIVPVETERSDAGLLAGAAKRVERWRKIARESSQQCRRMRRPVIDNPLKLAKLELPLSARFRLEEAPGAPMLMEVARDSAGHIALLVGPEGGWTDGERERLDRDGWTPASLGGTILRAETAAIASLSILGHLWLEKNAGPPAL